MATPCGSEGCAPAATWTPPPPAMGRATVNNKVMVVAVAVLFVVVLFIFALHLYAKWFWRNRGTTTIMASDGTIHTLSWRRGRYRGDPRILNPTTTATTVPQSVGLAREVVEALPLFEYSGGESKLECAVCLEDFEDGEKGRSLPKCGHNFHLDCIDMWLHSHSTCPLCRTNVAGDDEAKQTVVQIQAQEEVGDVRGPFMAAMRASRRRQRSLTSPTGFTSLPRTSENHDNADNRQQQESEIPPPETSWKDQGTPSVSGDVESRSASGILAPFQVTIDIPRAGAAAGVVSNNNSNPANALSPMARASASFRRLLSRGKNVVTPQSDDIGPSSPRPSSSSPSPPPPPLPPSI